MFLRFSEQLCESCKSEAKIRHQYRTLQILGGLMNQVQQKVLISGIVFGAIPILSFYIVLIIRMFNLINNVWLFGLMTMNAIGTLLVLLILLGGMANVCSASEKHLKHTLINILSCKNVSVREARMLKKFSNSCSTIKVRFGSLNYIDKLTPLNCIDFANCLSVQLLLVSK